MSALFCDSCDAGDFAQKWDNASSYLGWSSVTTTPLAVGRSIQKTSTGTALYRNITPSGTIIMGAFVNFSGVHAASASFPVAYFTFAADGGAVEHLFLGSIQTANTLYVARGSSLFGAPTPVILATISNVTYGWRYMEFKANIHDSAGAFEVRLDGVTVASASGVDTRNGGTSTDIDRVLLTGMSNSGSVTAMWDDIYCLNTSGSKNNDFLGPHKFRTMVPTGAGATTGLTPSSGANWTTVDELPFSAADYVQGLVGVKDTYATSNVATGVVPKFIQVNATGKRNDAPAVSIKPVIRSSSTDYAPASQAMLLTDATVIAMHEVNPAGSVDWTEASANAAEIGVEVVA